MKIRFHKAYLKAYRRLPRKIQLKAEKRIALFLENRSNPILKDHALTGNLINKRAFSVTGDYRIIYQEIAGEVVFVFLDIGTHSQVY